MKVDTERTTLATVSLKCAGEHDEYRRAAVLPSRRAVFLFGNFQLFDAGELFLERLRRPGGAADFVGADQV